MDSPSIPFVKMHGIGNDFIVIDALDATSFPESRWAEIAPRICDRHVGVGADGVVLVLPSSRADFRMRMFNPDGSESQMCGNGIRCFARHVYERGFTYASTLNIETLAGIKEVVLDHADGAVSSVRVNMGVPIFEAARIPVRTDDQIVRDFPVSAGGQVYEISCVSMGNPHAVCFRGESEVVDLDLQAIGPLFEHHPMFPERTNAEFCAVLDRKTILMRVWERGAGETLACGTGACASAVSAIDHGFVDRKVTMILDGGRLSIEWQGKGTPVYMTGPAAYVCQGTYFV